MIHEYGDLVEWLIDWLIDYVGWDWHLRTVVITGLFIPQVNVSVGALVMMMRAGDNSWLVYQSSLADLPEETSGASRRMDKGMRISYNKYLWYINESFTCRKILRHVTSSFTSHPKEGIMLIIITLKNPSPKLGFNPRPLGPVASTLTTAPPRRLVGWYWQGKTKELRENLSQCHCLL
jgi:hypothetical protein